MTPAAHRQDDRPAPGPRSVPAYRTLNAARRAGYAALPGEGFSYLLHLRPLEWPIMLAHTALGVVLALGVNGSVDRLTIPATAAPIVLALVLWVICLNGGTLAINSAFDRDEGDVGYLDAPPPPPRHLAWFSITLMVIGQLWAFAVLPIEYSLAYAACLVMSLLYSVPPVRLKAVAGADWVINMVGFGSLTPFAGWAATGTPLSATGAWIIVAFCPLFASLYPLTQLYQLDEDRARGDRTLALVIGLRASLVVAIAAAVIAFIGFAIAGRVDGIEAGGWWAIAAAFAAWMAVLGPWLRRAPAMTPREHKRGMYAALSAWAITDLAIIFAFAWRA